MMVRACMTILSRDSCQVEFGHSCRRTHSSGSGCAGQAGIAGNEAAVGLHQIWVTRLHNALTVVRCASDLLWPRLDPSVS